MRASGKSRAPKDNKAASQPLRVSTAVRHRHILDKNDWNVVCCFDGRQPIQFSVLFSLPLPRFHGTWEALEAILNTVHSPTRLCVAVQDLNIVNLVAKWHQNGAQQMKEGEEGMIRMHELIMSRRSDLEVKFTEPLSRLNIVPGPAAAKARVQAVVSSLFFMYPSHIHLDSFEVRFLDRTTASARYERFIWWGEAEVQRYIELAAEMGDAARLHPAVLAQEDPGMFWSICFLFKQCSSTLKMAGAPGWDPQLTQGIRHARKRANADMPAGPDGVNLGRNEPQNEQSGEHPWNWNGLLGTLAQVLDFLALLVQQYKSTILTQHAVDQHAGGQQHAQLAKTGYMLAISHALRWASPGSPLGIEQVIKYL